jgi:hypothetical protein
MNPWSTDFLASSPRYRALDYQNCAGVALMALPAGGSSAFVPKPHVNLYAEPLQVERYAQAVREEMDSLDRGASSLSFEVDQMWARPVQREALLAKIGAAGTDLWPLAVWKQPSALGAFQPRSGLIVDIDNALARYHRYPWGAFIEKYRALAAVFRGVVKHREAKSDSARGMAVIALGVQAMTIMRNPPADW